MDQNAVEYIRNHIKVFLPPEYQDADVIVKPVVKSNDRVLTGLTVFKEGSNMAPTVYEQTRDKVLAYALVLKDVQGGKVTGDIYPLDYAAHVERVKLLTCPVEKVTASFSDGEVVLLPYGNHKQLINGLASIHGKAKSILYEPESGRELSVILERERFKRTHHAKAGDLETYIAKLQKGTMRGRMKAAKDTVTKPDKGTPHKGVQER